MLGLGDHGPAATRAMAPLPDKSPHQFLLRIRIWLVCPDAQPPVRREITQRRLGRNGEPPGGQ